MTSSPGRRGVESICLEALARPVEERRAFLDGACAGDAGLRQEVEALLARAAGFMEAPAWAAPSTPLTAGTRLGPYEIQSAIGAGGMGEVYKARDTRLDRTVAIKVLPPTVSSDPERRARFEREAKTIAGLNHPHICTLHDVGEHDGSTFLVMEHIVGETLAARLSKGALPLDQALTIATEIAEALSAAHRQGVIHRDLKPANVMLTKAGAKLLDFGLAKLTGHGEAPAAVHVVSAAPTQAPLTGHGVIVGTLQYMAPEQLEGKPPDARTDLWALGAILYEMVTGKRAYEGTS
jgi:serine/threonine protein kinase